MTSENLPPPGAGVRPEPPPPRLITDVPDAGAVFTIITIIFIGVLFITVAFMTTYKKVKDQEMVPVVKPPIVIQTEDGTTITIGYGEWIIKTKKITIHE